MDIFLLFLLFLFKNTFEIVPIWNIANAAIDLIPTGNYHDFKAEERTLYGMSIILTRKIYKNVDGISYENYLKIGNDAEFKVDFDNIESFYNLNGIYLICPKGKYGLFNANSDARNFFSPSGFENKGNWDFKCFRHNTQYLLSFYLNNYEKTFYYCIWQETGSRNFVWQYKYIDYHQIYDFKLTNVKLFKDPNDDTQWYKHKMMGIILDNNIIKLQSMSAEFKPTDFQETEKIFIYNSNANPNYKELATNKGNTQAYFEYNSNHFYFFTYNNASDFISGYSTSTITGDNYHDLSNVNIHVNDESPFDFVDEVEIEDMNILLYNKYIYYSIKNTKNGKKYHGIYDIKLDKIMFNTDVEIDTFIPYSDISMLAITKDTAYQICAIKDDNNKCISECTDGLVIRDVDGNKCSTNCPNGKYLLVPDLICLSECDTSIYISNSTKHCGLCKNMDTSKPYRLIGSDECLTEIPEGAYLYNSKSNLLQCKSGYIFKDNNCTPHCYETCLRCSEYSNETNAQKCISCNKGYYLEGEQCLKIIIPSTLPEKIPTTELELIPTTFQV